MKTIELAEYKNHWALVTGASSGIGKEFTEQLAKAGLNIVLVARRKELLDSIAASLQANYQVKTLVIASDLTKSGSIDQIKNQLLQQKIKIRMLCNNAGIGQWGRFEKAALENYQRIIDLNTNVLVSMCHEFLSDLVSHPTSVVINVSSAAAYQPVPYMAVYAATKSFVQSFSQALFGEWQKHGVYVQTLVPGPTDTEFDSKAGAYESSVVKKDSVKKVVETSLSNLASGNPVIVATKGTYMQRVFAGLFPPKFVIKEVSKMFKPPGE